MGSIQCDQQSISRVQTIILYWQLTYFVISFCVLHNDPQKQDSINCTNKKKTRLQNFHYANKFKTKQMIAVAIKKKEMH